MTNLTQGEINILRAKLRAQIFSGLVVTGQVSIGEGLMLTKKFVDLLLKEEGIEK